MVLSCLLYGNNFRGETLGEEKGKCGDLTIAKEKVFSSMETSFLAHFSFSWTGPNKQRKVRKTISLGDGFPTKQTEPK